MIADKINTLLIPLVIVLFGFNLYSNEYGDYMHEIERSFANQMYTEFALLWSGDMNMTREKVKEMGMKFLTYRRATIEEARALELLVIDRFVQAINAHEKIQPFLDISPFSFKRVSISISFKGINGQIADGNVSYMLNVADLATTPSRNHIVYFSYDPFKDENVKQLAEPYEEALRLNDAASVDPKIHQENMYEDEMDALLASFTEDMQEQYGLKNWSIGGNWMNGINEIGGKFVLRQYITQEEARQLLVEVTEKLLSAVNSHEKLRPYLKEYPFPSNLLKIRICCEEQKYHPFPDVRMESIILNENIVTYVQEITHPKEEGKIFRESEKVTLGLESYPEALTIVENNPLKFKRTSPSIMDRLKDWFVRLMIYFYS